MAAEAVTRFVPLARAATTGREGRASAGAGYSLPRVVHLVLGRALSRRTFLRGVGASLALPWLDAMQPALRPRTPPPPRFVFVFGPNGRKMDEWRPTTWDGDLVLPPTLEPFAPLRERCVVLGNLALDGARAHGDGPGDHARAAAAFLTCAHPRKTSGTDLQCGVSIDQELATLLGADTHLRSLELGLEGGRAAGACDSGYACAYSNHIAWRTPSTPVAKETEPRAAFTRLFTPPGASAAFTTADRRSVLDAVRADATALAATLGTADRARLAEYLDAVRDVERRMEATAAEAPTEPDGLQQRKLDLRTRLRLMYEIIALALRADRTRVVTFMLGNAGSNRSYPFLDVPEGHHDLSHHKGTPDKLAKVAKIDRFHAETLATFCRALAAEPQGDGTLLDASIVLYGSGIADGNSHAHHDLPILLVGGGGGRLRGGRAVRPPRETPLANAYLTLLRWAGSDRVSFGDSTDALEL